MELNWQDGSMCSTLLGEDSMILGQVVLTEGGGFLVYDYHTGTVEKLFSFLTLEAAKRALELAQNISGA